MVDINLYLYCSQIVNQKGGQESTAPFFTLLEGPTSICSTIIYTVIAFVQSKSNMHMQMDARAHSCLLLVLSLFCIIFFCSSSAHGGSREQLPSVLVVGTVYCDTCFHQELSKSSHFISGASVAVECGDGAGKPGYRKVVATNRRGVFRVRLPPSISKHVHSIEACSVTPIKSNEPFCAVASSATAASLRLKSKRNGVHVYSAGFFSFKPLNQPEMCSQKPALLGDEKLDQPAFFLPSPSIPFLSPPSVGGVPLPSNPLFPPPSLLPPNPLQPPPSVLPPFPLQPPAPPAFNLPPIPLLTPPPPPPASPFPPVPFVPIPRFPGVPPAAFSSKKTSP